jgi:hypothetical protein
LNQNVFSTHIAFNLIILNINELNIIDNLNIFVASTNPLECIKFNVLAAANFFHGISTDQSQPHDDGKMVNGFIKFEIEKLIQYI